MPKLSLKETATDREERQWRKAQRAARKAARYHNLDYPPSDPSSSTSTRHGTNPKPHVNDANLDDEDAGWIPSESSVKFDYREDLRAEEEAFRAKLFDAMDLDAGQDSAQAHFNDYHIPSRWKDGAPSRSMQAATAMMADEEYVEYIRKGMWERSHKVEAEARARKEKERKERKEKEKTLKDKTARFEQEEVDKRRRRRDEKTNQRFVEGWQAYESRWTTLQQAAASSTLAPDSLDFHSLPWPAAGGSPTTLDGLTKDAISDFLLSPLHSGDKTKKVRVREALLLYHPDRFEGRLMPGVRERDRDRVKEAVGRVVRALTSMAEEAQS